MLSNLWGHSCSLSGEDTWTLGPWRCFERNQLALVCTDILRREQTDIVSQTFTPTPTHKKEKTWCNSAVSQASQNNFAGSLHNSILPLQITIPPCLAATHTPAAALTPASSLNVCTSHRLQPKCARPKQLHLLV